MPKAVVVDANVLIAAWRPDDDRHEHAAQMLESFDRPLLVPTMVLAEVMYFVSDKGRNPGAELVFVAAVHNGEILPIDPAGTWERIHAMASKYLDRQLGGVDASVVAAAELLQTKYIASLDMRDLSGIQLANGDYVELVTYAGHPLN